MNDICKLIKACSDAGVQSLTFGDLVVHFAPKSADFLTTGHFAPNIDLRSNQVTAPDPHGIPEEDRLELLKITDPLAYEEELVNQE